MNPDTRRSCVVIFVEKSSKGLDIPDFGWLLEKEKEYNTKFLWLVTPYCFSSLPSFGVSGMHIHFSENEPDQPTYGLYLPTNHAPNEAVADFIANMAKFMDGESKKLP